MRARVAIDALTDVTVGVGIDMFGDVEIIAVSTEPIALERAVRGPFAADVLAAVWTGAVIDIAASIDVWDAVVVGVLIDALADGVSSVGVGILAEADVNVLKAVMNACEFALPAL